MSLSSYIRILWFFVVLCAPALGMAQTDPRPAASGNTAATTASAPHVWHPPLVSIHAGKRVYLKAEVRHAWAVTDLTLIVRRVGEKRFHEVPFVRVSSHYEAELEAKFVQPPGFEYAIRSGGVRDDVRWHFATGRTPHRVNVYGYSDEMRVEDRLQAHHGFRHAFRLRGEWIRYGVRFENDPATGDPRKSDIYSDQLWFTELDYTYRLLGPVYDFRFGFGVMRGQRPTVGGQTVRWPRDPNDQPGLNYGYSDINFLAHEYLLLGARLVLGATETRFVGGAGARMLVGYPASTHFEAFVEGIGGAGYRSQFKFHLGTLPRVPMAVSLELTDWPFSERPQAANLVAELGWRFLDGTTILLRGGRANRKSSIRAGYLAGLTLKQEL